MWVSSIWPLLRYTTLCPLRSRAVPPSVNAPVAIALKVPFEAVLTSEMRCCRFVRAWLTCGVDNQV